MGLLRQAVVMVLVIVGGALALVLVATGFVEGMLWLTGVFGLQHALGMDTQTTHNYASVSGVLPIMVALLGFSSLVLGVWKHINCEQPGCWRPGHRHPDHGRPVCRMHYHHDVVPPRP